MTLPLRGGLLALADAVLAVAATPAPSHAVFGLFKKKERVVPGGQTGAATVSAAAAAAAISAYRKGRGQSVVTVAATLPAIALRHSQAMARAGKMSHSLGGNFSSRLGKGGYDALIAAENLAAGPRNLDEALASWRASKGHNTNLLKPGVTQIGIAVVYKPGDRYGNYWTLVLGTPDDGQRQGPDTGPAIAADGQ